MTQPNNPLHGVKLQAIVETLVRTLGWRRLGERVDIRCFNVDPSVKSSLKFLRRTPWARAQVEEVWLEVDAHHRAQRERFEAWVASGPALRSVVEVGGRRIGPLDFGKQSPWLRDPARYGTLDAFEALSAEALASSEIDLGHGGYLEDRPFYSSPLFAPGGKASSRSLHLGLDVWGPAGEAIVAPLPGRIHGFRQNDQPLDYGATIVLEHEVVVPSGGRGAHEGDSKRGQGIERERGGERGQGQRAIRLDPGGPRLRFWTLYGHLSSASIEGIAVGQDLGAGEVLATTGKPQENGGWPPHLHFQVMLDTLGYEGDFPGVADPTEGDWWARICPDPAPFFSFV